MIIKKMHFFNRLINSAFWHTLANVNKFIHVDSLTTSRIDVNYDPDDLVLNKHLDVKVYEIRKVILMAKREKMNVTNELSKQITIEII